MIHGQGYIIDVLYDDEKHHKGDNLYLGNSCYSLSQLSPGIIRHSCLCDFGIWQEHDYKKNFDPKRWDYITRTLAHDYGWTLKQVEEKTVLRRMGFRPLSPDSLPVIGAMQMYPNVVLNSCYGPQGFQSLYGSELVAKMIEGEDAEEVAGKKLWKAIRAKRFLI